MENRATEITSKNNKNVAIRVIPGHFATNHSHINYYVDMTNTKSRKNEAAAAAAALAQKYTSSTYIDTIICMDGCEVIGAYLADALADAGIMSMNQNKNINIITPEMDPGGQLIFRDNVQGMIYDKHCLLLLASATTGRTIERAVQCVRYYGGMVDSISAIFSASENVAGIDINYIFGDEDLPGYMTYDAISCPMCEQRRKIDAIVNSFGYSRL